MPITTPFHPRTSALCESLSWKEWAGYHAVCSYDHSHDREYYAFRHAAGMLDVTPLYKYDVSGAQAADFLSFVTVRDVRKLKEGRVTYLCWCDARGKVLDDGTVTCWGEGRYRMTSADPSYSWLCKLARGFDVEIEDVSRRFCALAVQGPRSRALLIAACDTAQGAQELEKLGFFAALKVRLAGCDVEVSRTGYTGDLGYEVWVENATALQVWDGIMEAGGPHGLQPCGLDALDVPRMEAGFILGGVDYVSARRAMIPAQTSSPYEIGMGWTVNLEREPFMGQASLRKEKAEGSSWALVGLEIDWDDLHALYDSFGLPPNMPCGGWRESIPIYKGSSQVGYATSGAWSPTLKKNLALATLRKEHASLGSSLSIEWTVEHQRRKVGAIVSKKPFFDPERKRK